MIGRRDRRRSLALAAVLKERVGLHVRPDSLPALRLALMARLERLGDRGPTPPSLPRAAGRPTRGDEELRQLLPLVTVGKTSFFRDQRQFDALAALLPGLLARARAGGPPARIWSAGCATGEEPYSIAMAAAEAGRRAGRGGAAWPPTSTPRRWRAAARGLYEARRGREIPARPPGPPLRRRGRDACRVRASLRRYVTAIRPHNLVSAAFPAPGRRPLGPHLLPQRHHLLRHRHHPAGAGAVSSTRSSRAATLFLGYSESLFRLFEGFDLTEVAGAFLYRKPEAGRVAGRRRPRPGPPSPPPRRRRRCATLALRAARRRRPPATSPAAARAARRRPSPRRGRPPLAPQEFLDGAVALFSEGRFGAARELLERATSSRAATTWRCGSPWPTSTACCASPTRPAASYQAALAARAAQRRGPPLLRHPPALARRRGGRARRWSCRAPSSSTPTWSLAHYYLGRCREAAARPAAGPARLPQRHRGPPPRPRGGKRQAFLGYYPDVPEDGAAFARAAEYALAAL